MNGTYAYTPYVLLVFASAVFMVVLLVYVWRRRSVPGATPLAVYLFCITLWLSGATLEHAALDLPLKFAWVKFSGVWEAPAATAQLWFALEFANLRRWLTRRTLALLMFPPLLVLGLILTNDVHHLIWVDFLFDGYVRPVRGLGTWVGIGYGYLLILASLLTLIGFFIRSPTHRIPIAFIWGGMLAVDGAYLANAVNINPVAPLNLNIFAEIFSAVMYALALFRFRMFGVLPIARATLVNQMREGMIVLDAQQQIADLNPSAEKILGVRAADAKGQNLTRFLPTINNLNLDPAKPGATQAEITLTSAALTRHYAVNLSPLKDQRGSPLGYLILLHDTTEQKQAQQQLVEQQRVVATLQERERLARELHDTLVQQSAAIRMQADTANQVLTQGDIAATQTNLQRIADAAQDMHLDLREYLFSTTSTFTATQNFFVALRAYLTQFGQRWTMQTQLCAPPDLEQQGLEEVVATQLWRIIQEALTNIRKHAAAHRIEISFERNATHIQLVIQDDGGGFDPTQITMTDAHGFGTRAMSERAQAIGGQFEIQSAPGKGTRVIVQVPVKSGEMVGQ